MKIKSMLMGLALFSTLGINANPISRAEARLVAQEFVGIDDNTTDNVPVSPYYVFSRGEGKGYVIVSGDDSTTPIIGYTDSGDFRFDSLPDGLKEMLNSWSERITKVQKMPQQNPTKRSARARLDIARRGIEGFKANWEDIPIMCPTHWHQNFPYNMYCPTNPDAPEQRAVTGCVATAAAQIVYYFRRDNPDTLLYDTPTYGYGWPVTRVFKKGTPIRYNLMRTSGSGTDSQNDAVATLMAVVGAVSYLTYGSSTAGQPDQAGQGLSGQFNLSNEYVGKWNYNQQGWETTVYNSLKKGSPMLYGATHPEQGGHAVVLDGYQASTGLYHFNFGWGGTGDGYFTIDDETGMNGFNADQRGCLNFRPRKQNLAGKLNVDELFIKADNTVRASVTNKGTLTYSTFQLRASTNGKLPSDVIQTVNTTPLKYNESADIEFKYKPTSNTPTSIFLTDGNGNIIDSCTVTPTQTKCVLTLEQMTIDAGEDVVTFGENDYKVVNNKAANIVATLTNGEDGTYGQPSVRCILEAYNTTTNKWATSTSKMIKDSIFHKGETLDLKYRFEYLKENTYYRVKMDPTVRAGINTKMTYATTDTVIYFMVRTPDLDVTIDNKNAVVSGTWNEMLFASQMGNDEICTYDMTAVQQLSELPTVPNPNALFYTNEKIEGAVNNVVGNTCDKLVIHEAHNFMPKETLLAQEVTFVFDNAEPGIWYSTFLPFKADIPYGMQAKVPTKINSSYIDFEFVTSVDAMTPFIYLVTNKGVAITTENVEIGTTNTISYLEDNVWGSTIKQQADATWRQLGMKNNLPYFMLVGEDVTTTTPFAFYILGDHKYDLRAFASSEAPLDKAYRDLATSINKAYNALEEGSPYATNEQIDALKNVLKDSEDMFTYRTGETNSIDSQKKNLEEAIATFLEAVSTDIHHVNVDSQYGEGAQVEFYTLSGMRLTKPQRGIVIMKQGDTRRKIIIR